MRKLFYILPVVFILLGCEDVIDVDVPVDRPRLTVDAVFRLDVSEPIQTVQVKVGQTSGFFDELQTTSLDAITLINPDYVPTGPLDLNSLVMTEVAPGIYEGSKTTIFFTEGTLQLILEHQGERFLAQTAFVPTSDIDELAQGDGSLFGGDETEIIVSFTDQPDREDFYLFDLDFNEYLVTEDEFYPGQRFEFSYFYDESVNAGMDINVSLLGVDELFYNYMNQIIVQANSGSTGPFQTPSATVRGNIINITGINNIDSFDNVENSDNFALGYFAICQTFTKTITIE